MSTGDTTITVCKIDFLPLISYRFDAGGWFRYDDTVVTETNINSVRLVVTFVVKFYYYWSLQERK